MSYLCFRRGPPHAASICSTKWLICSLFKNTTLPIVHDKAGAQTMGHNGRIMHSCSLRVQHSALSLSRNKTLGYFYVYGKLNSIHSACLNDRLTLLCEPMTNQIVLCSVLANRVSAVVVKFPWLLVFFFCKWRKLFTFGLFADVKPRVVCQPLGRGR